MNKEQRAKIMAGDALTDAEYINLGAGSDVKKTNIVKQFGSWAVTKFGLESLTIYYPIEKERLGTEDWINHMFEKRWVIRDHFSAALKAARDYHKC